MQDQLRQKDEEFRQLLGRLTRTVAQLETAKAALATSATSATSAAASTPFQSASQRLRSRVIVNGAVIQENESALCEALRSLGLSNDAWKHFLRKLKAGSDNLRKDRYGTFNGIHQLPPNNSDVAVRASLKALNAQSAVRDAAERQRVCDALKLPMTFFALPAERDPNNAHIACLVPFYGDNLRAHAERAKSTEAQAALFAALYKVLYDTASLNVFPADCKLENYCYALKDGTRHVVIIDPDAYVRCPEFDNQHIARMGIVALFTAYISTPLPLPWFFDKLLALVRDIYHDAYAAYCASKSHAFASASCADRTENGPLLQPIAAMHARALASLLHTAAAARGREAKPLRRALGALLGDVLCYLQSHCGNRAQRDPLYNLYFALIGSRLRGGPELDTVRSHLSGTAGVLYTRDAPGATVLADHRADVGSKFFVFIFHTLFAMCNLPGMTNPTRGSRDIQRVSQHWTDHALALQVKCSASKAITAYSAFAAAATRPAFHVQVRTPRFGDLPP